MAAITDDLTNVITIDLRSIPAEGLLQQNIPYALIEHTPSATIDHTLYEVITTKDLDQDGYTKVGNAVIDYLPSILNPYEVLVYLKLYRLSYGFHKSTCLVGYTGISKATRISLAQVRRAVSKLVSLGLLRIVEVIKTKQVQGTVYEVRVPRSALIERTVQQSSIKERLDDKEKKDHLQRVMKLYSHITGNEWQRSDDRSYDKLKHLSLDELSLLLRTTMQRATTKPNTLAYFVKVHQTPIEINQASRMVIKRKLEGFISRFKELQVGRKYTIADLSGYVKDACAREGVTWDNEIFNQLIGG